MIPLGCYQFKYLTDRCQPTTPPTDDDGATTTTRADPPTRTCNTPANHGGCYATSRCVARPDERARAIGSIASARTRQTAKARDSPRSIPGGCSLSFSLTPDRGAVAQHPAGPLLHTKGTMRILFCVLVGKAFVFRVFGDSVLVFCCSFG